jgi:hypothetical protein
MNEQPDPIDAVMKVLKREAQRRRKKTDWERVENALETIFAELALARILRGLNGQGKSVAEKYRRVWVPDASITEARELLSRAKKAFAAAQSLPIRLSEFATKTYGNAGLSLMPWKAVKAYTDALANLEPSVDTLEHMFEETLFKAGKTRGMKGPLLERVIGTPIEHFLQGLIPLWHEATGSEVLGKKFESIAKELIEATLPNDNAGNRPEIKEMKRQIENAKRRGEVVQTQWTHIKPKL